MFVSALLFMSRGHFVHPARVTSRCLRETGRGVREGGGRENLKMTRRGETDREGRDGKTREGSEGVRRNGMHVEGGIKQSKAEFESMSLNVF